MIELNWNYTLIIGIGIIGNSNYNGTSLGELIQELKLQGKIIIQLLQICIYWGKYYNGSLG